MIRKMENIDKIIKLNGPDDYCDLYGLTNNNSLVSVVELDEATTPVQCVCNFGFYAMFLKHIKCGTMRYGITTYDYDEGTIVSIGPGQVVSCETHAGKRPRCTALLFSPSLIKGTALGRSMNRFSFFSYSSNEALHMSDSEREIIVDCLAKIKTESEEELDKHSRAIVVKNIELLLEYCLRFYDRQFETRSVVNSDILQRFESLLSDYMNGSEVHTNGLPTVKYFADKICLSPNYFGDLIKKLTGKTAQQYILDKIVDLGREMILGSDKPISEIAYDLGFQYPQHFSRFFKKRTGCTPMEYKAMSK